MSEQLHTHRTWFDLRHLKEVLHDFLMRFAPAPYIEPAREDIAWVSKWANLTYTSELNADAPAQETIDVGGKPFACERMKMLASTVTDPPMVPKQTIEFKGTVWRTDATPFGVVRAEWLEKTTKNRWRLWPNMAS